MNARAPVLLGLEKTIFGKKQTNKTRENHAKYLRISITTIHSASLAFILYVTVANLVPLRLKTQCLYLYENIHKTYDSSDILILSVPHHCVALQCYFQQCLSVAASISFSESKGLLCDPPVQVFAY